MKYFYTTSKLSENMHETPEGFLVCVGVPIARTGEMIYDEKETPLVGDESGKVVITRDENEVFNPKTMASFEGKPLTITHPTEFVTPENWGRLAKGVVQNVRRGEGDQKNDLIADLLVTDSVAINLIKNGLREVSCGYEANYIQGDDGEGKQTRIVGNHLALVDQGRAGSSYAINDHKRKGIEKMSIKEKITSIFAKATDEAMKVAKDEAGEKEQESKSKDADESKKEEKAKDEDCKDADQMKDELVKMFDALKEKMGDLLEMKKSKDADEEEGEKEKSKDDEASIEDRLKALEAAVSKLLEKKAGDDDEDASEYEDEDKELESEDEDFEENTMTGDAKSRLEILAPGFVASTKDFKKKALETAYKTSEGKKVIDSLTGGKPTFDSAEKIDTLFIAASEVLKASRTSALSETKKVSVRDNVTPFTGGMTAEKINELNNKFYQQGK